MHPLKAAQLEAHVWYIENAPQVIHVRASGQWITGYPEEFARRIAAALNACEGYSLAELEAGVVQANQDSLEYAVEKIRLLEVLAAGCSLHPGYRAQQRPRVRIHCPTCEGMWKAKLRLQAMSAATPEWDVEAAMQILSSLGIAAEEVAQAIVGFGRSVAALVEERLQKEAESR